ncbi:MAG: hypothetical protein M1828_005240 [Chrysothrix sp. TS-e1954]|nr:MAG: hypothetical protein M1828_005240 [Chrysothrix sp. TS-e1954]
MESPTIIPPTPITPFSTLSTTVPDYDPSTAPPPSKRFKPNELPLTSHQRSTIDTLIHTFKKQGAFDVVRKSAYSTFESSPAKTSLIASLTQLADAELDKNPGLLAKDRRQAAPLIEGAVERSEIYRIAELDVEKIVETCAADADSRFRSIRVAEIGAEKAAAERENGSKSDEAYAAEARQRLEQRRAAHEAQLFLQREREAEEKRLAAAAAAKKREEEERERQRRREWEQEMVERAERKKRQDAEWERERLEKANKERRRWEGKEDKERGKWEKEREKEVEEAALEELLKEGKAAARAAERNEALYRGKETKVREVEKERAVDAIMRREKREREAGGGRRYDSSPSTRSPAVDDSFPRRAHYDRHESRHRDDRQRSSSHADSSAHHHRDSNRGDIEPDPRERERRSHKYHDDPYARSSSKHDRQDLSPRRQDPVDEGRSSHRRHDRRDSSRDRDRHHPRRDYEDHHHRHREQRSISPSQIHHKRTDYPKRPSHRDERADYPRHHSSHHPDYRTRSRSPRRSPRRSPPHHASHHATHRTRSPPRPPNPPHSHTHPASSSSLTDKKPDKDAPVEIDRYIPSGSSRSMVEGGRSRIVNRAEEEERRKRSRRGSDSRRERGGREEGEA